MPKKKTFETALAQLEAIVKEMESGDLPLEDAVKQYETGIKQAKFCMDILDATEQKITRLTRNLDDTLKEEPFEEE